MLNASRLSEMDLMKMNRLPRHVISRLGNFV